MATPPPRSPRPEALSMAQQLENLSGRKRKTHDEIFVDIITEPPKNQKDAVRHRQCVSTVKESDKELSREITAVANASVAAARESTYLATDSLEKGREMQRQFLEAILSLNALL